MRVEERPVHTNKQRRRQSRRRRKRGKRLIIAYALQIIFAILVTLASILMFCVLLYILGHLSHGPENESSTSNIGNLTDDTTQSGVPIIPVEPAFSGEIRVVLDAGHGGNQPGCVIKGHYSTMIIPSNGKGFKSKEADYEI